MFTYVFYALVVVVSIYGLTQTKNIFTGLADTECSLLQFFDQILYGEVKEITPKWIGINEIDTILANLETRIQEMSNDNLMSNFEYYLGEIDTQRDEFMTKLKSLHKNFYEANEIDPLGKYTKTYTYPQNYYQEGTDPKYLDGKYALDLIEDLGKYDTDTQKFTD